MIRPQAARRATRRPPAARRPQCAVKWDRNLKPKLAIMRQCTSVTDRRTDGLASWHKREMYILHLELMIRFCIVNPSISLTISVAIHIYKLKAFLAVSFRQFWIRCTNISHDFIWFKPTTSIHCHAARSELTSSKRPSLSPSPPIRMKRYLMYWQNNVLKLRFRRTR